LSRGPLLSTDTDGKAEETENGVVQGQRNQGQLDPCLVYLKDWADAESADLLFSAHSTEGHGADENMEVSTIVTLMNGQHLLGSSTIKGSADENEKQGERWVCKCAGMVVSVWGGRL
jgi:hypothetical protein